MRNPPPLALQPCCPHPCPRPSPSPLCQPWPLRPPSPPPSLPPSHSFPAASRLEQGSLLRERKKNGGIHLQFHRYSLHKAPPAGDCEPSCLPTWLGGARRVVATGIGGGRGGLGLRRRRPGGGLVHTDLGFELGEAPSSVDVFKLLNLWRRPEDKARLAIHPHFS